MMSSIVERLNEPKILDCAGTIKNPATCAAGLSVSFLKMMTAPAQNAKFYHKKSTAPAPPLGHQTFINLTLVS
jgi:hypothetical protein